MDELTLEQAVFLFSIIRTPGKEAASLQPEEGFTFDCIDTYERLLKSSQILYKEFGPLALKSPFSFSINEGIEVIERYRDSKELDLSKKESGSLEIWAALIIDNIGSGIITLGKQPVKKNSEKNEIN